MMNERRTRPHKALIDFLQLAKEGDVPARFRYPMAVGLEPAMRRRSETSLAGFTVSWVSERSKGSPHVGKRFPGPPFDPTRRNDH